MDCNMIFSEIADSVILRRFKQGSFIHPNQCEALKNHADFFDNIPDNDKVKIAQDLFSEIESYNAIPSWTTTPPTAKPTRVIKQELQTVTAYIELLNKIYSDMSNCNPFFGKSEEYENAQVIAKKIKHDLEILQKKCKQSDLLILQKSRYYQNTKTKQDIENTIRDIMKNYSIAIDYLSIQDVRAFIARL
jgi:hypothetical protein